MRRVVFFTQIALILLLTVTLAGCVGENENSANTMLVHVSVLRDQPEPSSEYELREGEPKNVGIYEFYLKKPGVPGSGTFKKLGSISLDKSNEMEFYGQKWVKRIDGILCIGYPSTNLIDGKACVEIDQSQNEVDITIHYWKTTLGILSRSLTEEKCMMSSL